MAHISPLVYTQMYASDGFFLNLCAVLLRLSQPFSQPSSPKLLKIDPTYIHGTSGDRNIARDRGIHMINLDKETCLIPRADGETLTASANKYSFICECFFLTHTAINVGMHVTQEKFLKLNQELHRIQNLHNDVVAQGAEDSAPGLRIKDQMEKGGWELPSSL